MGCGTVCVPEECVDMHFLDEPVHSRRAGYEEAEPRCLQGFTGRYACADFEKIG
jgi:hypothetical protein